MELLLTLATLAAVWVGTPYVLGPIAVWRTLSVPERHVYPRLDAAELLAGDVRAQRPHADLLGQGFVAAGATRVDNVHGLLYVCPDDGATACLMLTRKFVATVFSQRFLRTRLSLSNVPLPSPYPRWDRKIDHHLPGCRDVAPLFAHFRAIRARLALPDPVPATAQCALEQAEAFENEQLTHLVEIGYFAAMPHNGRRRATFPGALKMAWKLAWPSKSIVLALAARHARRVAGID